MVLLSGRANTVPQIATMHACGQDVVRTWLHRYGADGVGGLEDEARSGRPPQDALAAQIVETQASQPPPCSGHGQICWTVVTLAVFLATSFRLVLSRASVRRHPRSRGWRWERPRLAPARQQGLLAGEKQETLVAARTGVAQGRGHLLYLDECDLHLLPVVRAMWMKGRRVRVPTPGTTVKRAFFGALDAASGRPHGRSRADAGGHLCDLPPAGGHRLPHRPALRGHGHCADA